MQSQKNIMTEKKNAFKKKMRSTNDNKTKDSAGKRFLKKRGNLPSSQSDRGRMMLLGSWLLIAKGGNATTLWYLTKSPLKKVLVATFKFRFILPNLYKTNWQDLVTFWYSKYWKTIFSILRFGNLHFPYFTSSKDSLNG